MDETSWGPGRVAKTRNERGTGASQGLQVAALGGELYVCAAATKPKTDEVAPHTFLYGKVPL